MDRQNDFAVADRIKAKLEAALDPVSIKVNDESYKHAGHAHAFNRAGPTSKAGGTHVSVKVVSHVFKGKSRIERHRAINLILRAEFAAGVHALAIEAKAPGE
jgi:BolA protein